MLEMFKSKPERRADGESTAKKDEKP